MYALLLFDKLLTALIVLMSLCPTLQLGKVTSCHSAQADRVLSDCALVLWQPILFITLWMQMAPILHPRRAC